MKIGLFGISGIAPGKHNLKDPRLDQVDLLVEAQKKAYAQVDVVPEKELLICDAILTSHTALSDLLMKDLDFVETRMSRDVDAAEKSILLKLANGLVSEQPVSAAGLSAGELEIVSAHNFYSNRPVVVASEAELASPDALLMRAFAQGGFISFLTVGGKENRAWPIRAGMTAWEAAGTIHSDIQHGFIRAEVISFADMLAAGGETQAKRAGKLRLELKTYVIQDYDVVNFRFNK
jgi:ribosome-binding ATPase YchF (GTP1/OBG family)